MTTTPLLTFAVGDIHGCARQLRSLFEACVGHAADRAHRFIFLGDYVDRGPHSKDVIEFLVAHQAIAPDGFICLCGNHEDMLVTGADDLSKEGLWFCNGGDATLES